MGFEIRSKNWFRRQGLPSRKSVPGRSHQGDGRTEESQAQPNTPMNPSDLLAETVFGKRASSKRHHPAGPHFGVENLAPKVGALLRRNGFAAPVLGSEIGTPKRGPTNAVFFPHFWAFQRAPSTPSDVPKHVGRNARALPSLTTSLLRQLAHHHHNAHRGGSCQRDRILDRISDIFGSHPATLFFQQRATSLRTFPTHWFPRLKQLLCVRKRVAHVCCAALAQCMPVHAHRGAHACSVPQEERKSQCTICQSCNLTPTLLHIGSKQPRTAYYVQHLPEPTHVLVGHIASHSTAQQISKREIQQPELAEQLGLAYLPSPTLRIKESDTVTVSLAVHGGNITRQAAAWEQTLTMHAPTQCIACHYLAHITSTTLTPNHGHCQGTAIQALVQGAIHITATYTSEEHEGTAEAAVITAHWPHQAQQRLMPDKLPTDLSRAPLPAHRRRSLSKTDKEN